MDRIADQLHPGVRFAPCIVWAAKVETLLRYVQAANRVIAKSCSDPRTHAPSLSAPPAERGSSASAPHDVIEID